MTASPGAPLGERALVIVPTFDHGPMLEHSVGSALGQAWGDLEVVVVCDGAPETTRDLLEEFRARDPRVSYRWCANGPRLGEIHRNEVLATTTADFVCYLSDDDLWAPTHLAAMHAALALAPVAHTNHLYLDGAEGLHAMAVSFDDAETLAAHVAGSTFVCLSTIGHTLDAVRTHGLEWRTTPVDRHTDWYFLTGAIERGLIPASTSSFTALNLAGIFRRHRTQAERLDEMERWARRVATEWERVVHLGVRDHLARQRSASIVHERWLAEVEREREERLAELASVLARLERARLDHQHALAEQSRIDETLRTTVAHVEELAGEVERLRWAYVACEHAWRAERDDRERLAGELAALRATRAVRLQGRVARNRVVRGVARRRAR